MNLRPLASALLALVTSAVLAQPPSPDDSLYQAFGGKAGIDRVMADLMPRLQTDDRIGHFFKETKMTELQKQLADQVCVVSGGPCHYEGGSMKDAHADLKIRKSDFNALVELLQQSMDAQGIAFTTQNRLLARLAPMHRDVINTR